MDPVLIVGAGPVGLIQALMLSRLDVPAIIIDRHHSHLDAPKAHVVTSRSLEILRQFGVPGESIRAAGTPREEARWVRFVTNLSGETVGTLPLFGQGVDTLKETSEMVHNIPQPKLEQLITDLLQGDDKVEIRRGWTWVSGTQDEAGVTSTVQNTSTGEEETIRSSFVIACDGANSRVVKCLNVDFDTEEGEDTIMTIHFSADLRPIIKDKVGMLHWVIDPSVRGVIIAYDLGGNLALLHNALPTESIDDFTEEKCKALIHSSIGCDAPFTFLSCLPWRFRRQVAKEYSVGRVAFAGDAAHSFPPTGGFGLNTGIADAHNLSYKLAAVYHNRADLTTVLASYQAERQPVAKRNAWQSVVWGRKIFDLVKAFKTAELDVEKAKKGMEEALADPEQRKLISDTIADQEDHFNSTNLDLGYVYEPNYRAEEIIQYVPAQRKGARLVHAWIDVKNPSVIGSLPPVDLDYLGGDITEEQRRKWSYSILDLVQPGTYLLIHGTGGGYSNLSDALQQRQVLARRAVLGQDFTFVDVDEGADFYGLKSGKAVLVRPDQHVEAILGSDADEEVDEVVKGVMTSLQG